MKVAALDLSLTRPAVCVDGTVTVIDTPKVKTGDLAGKHRRLEVICTELYRLLFDDMVPRVDLVAIEAYAYGAKGRAITGLAELGGIVRHDLWDSDLPYIEVAAQTIKKYATGKGNASKDEVLSAAHRRQNARHPFTGVSNDEADAWWLWAAVSDAHGWPKVKVPDSHRSVLGKVDTSTGAEA